MRKFIMSSVLLLLLVTPVAAYDSPTKLGVHILEPEEINQVSELLPNGGFVTVPIRLDQLQEDRWQKFFDEADRFHLTPLLRLATGFDGENWTRPTRRDIVTFTQFLSSLDWHSDDLRIVAFNEPNHAAEWGGAVDPSGYGESLTFLTNWFQTEPRKYLILGAGLDAAAPNSRTTMASSTFLNRIFDSHPEAIAQLDGWVAHAYPNPHFSGKPTDSHRQSIRSYEYELKKISSAIDKELPVYITETGWNASRLPEERIARYFTTAYEDVWDPDENVVSVTPFVLSAQEGPFVSFSLIDGESKPTALYETIQALAGS